MAESALLQILYGFRMAVELQLIEGGGLFQQAAGVRRRDLLLEAGDTLAERQAL